MKLFVCSQCRNLLYFNNISCGACGARLGFLPDKTTLVALDGVGDGLWQPVGWPDHFVSAYASAHPWEDWAETWAHYLHICDTLETAFAFGLRIQPRLSGRDTTDVQNGVDAYDQEDFQQLIVHWFPLTLALNSLNRSMGHEHAYPFVLAPAVVEKLGFVHRVVRAGRCPPKPQNLGSALQA